MGSLVAPLLIAGLMLLMATGLDWNLDLAWHDQHRIEQIVLLVVVGLGWISPWRKRVEQAIAHLPVWAVWTLAGIGGAGLLSAAMSAYPRFALLEWATFVLLAGLGFLVAQAYRDRPSAVRYGMAILLAAVGTVVLVKVMVGYAAALMEGVRLDTVLLFEGTFSNRRFFGQAATLLIPLFVWAGISNARFRAGWFALACAWWMLVFVSGTRGTWLALAMAHACVLFWVGRRAFTFVRWQLLAAVSGLAVYWVLFYGLPPLLGMEAGVENRLDHMSSLSGREVIWNLAGQYMLEHPWLGIGPMHFAAVFNPVAAHPHNAILQLAAEWGIPAALAAMVLVLGGLIAFARPLRQRADVLRLVLLTSLLAVCVQSMVDGVIVIPYTQTWLAVLAGWALGVHWGERTIPQASLSRLASAGLRMGGILALGLLIWGVGPEILNRPAATAAYLEHHGNLAPRYWAQGWIDTRLGK
jgi:O-antigen ligase